MRWVILSFGLMIVGCEEKVVWDCTENAAEMGEWVKDCHMPVNLESCTRQAMQIFCKPHVLKEEKE